MHLLRILLLVACLPVTASAADWPQILGPQRNGVSQETVNTSFGKTGPLELWQIPVGSGFAGVAVKGELLILFHREGNQEIASALRVDNGQTVWTQKFPTRFSPGFTSDAGPRCVPLVHGERVYLFGATGGLRCLSLNDGSVLWEQETHRKYKAAEGYFGAGSTPVLDNNRLIVNVGARKGAGVVAFDATSGKELWKASNEQASYSSPLICTIQGKKHALVVTRLKTISFNPENGEIRFEFPFGKRGPTVNGASPVLINDKLFLTASYGIGAQYHRIKATEAPAVWKKDVVASQYCTPVPMDDMLFVVDGRQDTGDASLVCLDPENGGEKWREDGLDYGTIIRANKTLLVLTCAGELIFVEASDRGYKELARHSVLKESRGGYRLPALANGRLFIRDDSTLKCLDITAK